jgi:hypothetical protein
VLFKLGLVLFDYVFANEFSALDPPLINDDLVVLPQLDLIVFDGFVE